MNKQNRTWTDEDFILAVKESLSVAQVLVRLGLNPSGSNYKSFYKHAERLSLDFDHFTGKAWNQGERFKNFGSKRTLEDILVENSDYLSTTHLKNRLLASGLLQYHCAICKLTEWLELPIALQLDHINGIPSDNRIENLRLLCPNCHAQTDTFAGKNIGRHATRARTQILEKRIASKAIVE